MTSNEHIDKDLRFVASAVRRRDSRAGVPAIFFLWAVLFLVGWALPDFAPQWTGPFWLVAGIGGGVLSWWLGARHAVAQGDVDREYGMRQGLHWAVCGLAFLGVFLPLILGAELDAYASLALGRQFLLVIALAYALAAVHLERGLTIPAVIMAVGYIALNVWSPAYLWTTMGVLIAVSLVVAGIQARQ